MLIVLIILLSVNGRSLRAKQSPDIAFHSLSTLDGLSQGSNAFIHHDSRGFVWLSSIDGLNRYDGKTVKVYRAGPASGLIGNIITSNFFEDSQGNLWFTAYEGIQCYLRQEDRCISYQLPKGDGGKYDKDYYAFHYEDERLWLRVGVGSAARLMVFDTEKEIHEELLPASGNRMAVITNDSGRVTDILDFHFSSHKGLDKINLHTKKKTTYLADQGGTGFGTTIYDLEEAEDKDNYWLASEDGLIHLSLKDRQIDVYNRYNGMDIGSVWTLEHLDDRLLLLGTSNFSLLFFDKRTNKITEAANFDNASYNLPFKKVNGSYLDHTGTLWLSSVQQGVAFGHLRKRKFQCVRELQETSVTTIFEDNFGRVWTDGSTDSLFLFEDRIDPIKVPIYQENGSPNRFGIKFFIQAGEDEIFAMSSRSIYRWDEEKRAFYFQQQLPVSVISLTPFPGKPDGWLLTAHEGIYRVEKKEDAFALFTYDELGQHQKKLATKSYFDHSGRLYLSVDATHLEIFDFIQASYELVASIPKIGYGHSFYEIDDHVWVATSVGLLKIEQSGLRYSFPGKTPGSLPQEAYYGILPGVDHHSFWLSGNQGLLKYNLDSGVTHRFKMADGLQGLEYSSKAFLLDACNRMWFGGSKGLNVFYPDSLRLIQTNPQIGFVDLLVNDEPYGTIPNINEIDQVELAYENNTFSLQTRALEYSDPSQTVIQYRLDKFDKNWVSGNHNGFVRYANLAPGKYELQIRAANSDGIFAPDYRSLVIKIRTPWFLSWWFWMIVLLLSASLIYAIFQYRLNQVLKLERIRLKISHDLHDDVGSILTGLAMKSEILELSAAPTQKKELSQLGTMSRRALSRLRDTVWAIDASKDNVGSLMDRMLEHAEEILSPREIQFSFQNEGINPEDKLTADVRQNLYLIFKEAATNTAKHSTGNQLSVKLQQSESGIHMTIYDNGRFREKKYRPTGTGMDSMAARANKIGANFLVDTTRGFKIKVSLL